MKRHGYLMSADPASSVPDPRGRVHGMEGIHVADASFFPAGVA